MNNKKIGIITFHSAHNCGANLQAFALQKVLNNDYDTEIIDYRNNIIDAEYKLFTVNKDSFKSRIKSVLISLIFLKSNLKRIKSFEEFIDKKLVKTKKVYKTESDLKNDPPIKDVYITGSDQVWSSSITKGLQDSYTLNFGNNDVYRISYSASIGSSKLSEPEQFEFCSKLRCLDKISVREDTAKNILQPILDNQIDVVLDPTLLLDNTEWEKEITNLPKEREKYIFGYVIGYNNEYINVLNELSRRTGLKVIHCARRNKNIENILRNAYTDGPLEFINLIKNAEYVVTTSFHATVFSIIFNKKFFVVPYVKSSRITDLLDKLNLSDRCVYSLEDFKQIDFDSDIDYKLTNKILREERAKSLTWLKNAIKNSEGK